MKEHTVSARMSRDIVNLLVERGMSQSSIAELLGVTKSFISRVRAGTRNFTLNHLGLLEEALGQSLPLLLIEAISTESFSTSLRHVFESSTGQLLETSTGTKSADAKLARIKSRSHVRGRKLESLSA